MRSQPEQAKQRSPMGRGQARAALGVVRSQAEGAKQRHRLGERGGRGRRWTHGGRATHPDAGGAGGTDDATEHSHRNESQQVTDVKVSNLHPLYLTGQTTNVNASTTNVNANTTNVISILKREHSEARTADVRSRAKPAEAAGAAKAAAKERSGEASRSGRSSEAQCAEGKPEALCAKCAGGGGGEAAQRKSSRRSAQAGGGGEAARSTSAGRASAFTNLKFWGISIKGNCIGFASH